MFSFIPSSLMGSTTNATLVTITTAIISSILSLFLIIRLRDIPPYRKAKITLAGPFKKAESQ